MPQPASIYGPVDPKPMLSPDFSISDASFLRAARSLLNVAPITTVASIKGKKYRSSASIFATFSRERFPLPGMS